MKLRQKIHQPPYMALCRDRVSLILWVVILPTSALAKYRRHVVMADGSFDPLHHGHIAYLRAAASLGYPLLVNICPDAETRQKHPILLSAVHRAEILTALGCVVYVHVSEQPTVEVLRVLHPMVYAKGADWVDRLPAAIGQVCDELKIRVRYVGTPQISSTAILKQFQPDVDAFERLVLGQQPADKPWEPVTDYSFAARRPIEQPHADILIDTFQPTRVGDVGCGPGVLIGLLAERGIGVHGFDKDRGAGGNCTRWDVTTPLLLAMTGQPFDLIVCREVLEHLTILQIRRAVRNLCALSSQFVYLTSRFHTAQHFLDFATSDDLDPTHISIMPMPWLRHLFTLEGFKRRADLEQRMDHRNLGRVLVYERVV